MRTGSNEPVLMEAGNKWRGTKLPELSNFNGKSNRLQTCPASYTENSYSFNKSPFWIFFLSYVFVNIWRKAIGENMQKAFMII